MPVQMPITTIRAVQIRNSNITTAKIADSAVTSRKISDSNITSRKINNSAVTTEKIANLAVTSSKIADSTITSAKIKNSAVTTQKLADLAVTSSKIATSTITSTKIKNSAVTTQKIADLAVTSSKIATSTITGNKIKNSTISTEKIANNAITSSKIAANSIGSAKIKNSTITLVGLRVTGNTVLMGTTTWIGSTNLVVTDPLITVGSGAVGASAIAEINGLEVDRGSSSKASVYFNETTDLWYVNTGTGGGKQIVTLSTATARWVENEVKTFTETTVSWQLSKTPNPTGSLRLYFNGQRMRASGNDFTLTNSTVAMVIASMTSQDVVVSDFRW